MKWLMALVVMAGALVAPAAGPANAVDDIPRKGADISWPNCPKGMGIPSRRTLGLPLPKIIHLSAHGLRVGLEVVAAGIELGGEDGHVWIEKDKQPAIRADPQDRTRKTNRWGLPVRQRDIARKGRGGRGNGRDGTVRQPCSIEHQSL